MGISKEIEIYALPELKSAYHSNYTFFFLLRKPIFYRQKAKEWETALS